MKTSIYVDRELWDRFKKYALSKGMGASRLLEELMVDEMVEEAIGNVLLGLTGSKSYEEVDFKPIKPRKGIASELVRVMRDEGINCISRW